MKKWCPDCKRNMELEPVNDNIVGIKFICPCGALFIEVKK
jgi:hypothetical protein